jgi:hypothetical protein
MLDANLPPPSGDGYEYIVTTNRNVKDTASVLEVPNIKPGPYRLRLSIPKTNWLYTRKYETCLSFDFLLDYTEIQPEREASNTINIYSVVPRKLADISLNAFISIEVNFSRKASLSRLVKNLNEEAEICWLEPKFATEDRMTIRPRKQFIRGQHAVLDFEFSVDSDRIRSHFNQGNCYKLACDSTGELKLKMNLGAALTDYCFSEQASPSAVTLQGADQCNPFSAAKFEGGACICPFPYDGKNCE